MAETEFKYDVFVSYSSANKEWVRKTFVPILENAGLKVCDYYRDFDVGAPIIMEMERAILESRKSIPVLSPAYLGSGWTEFESLMLQTLDAANRERKLLPVILESCELPLRIKYMNCINFANPDDIEIEWQRLSRALGVTLSPSLLEPRSPDIRSRETWHLAHPYPMPPNFTGRATELKMLDNWLAEDKDRLFILRALGGFGKSALAWQWINTHVNPAEWTKLVWWSFYEGDASFEHFIEETLKYLKLEIPQGQRLQVDELLKAMQSQKILLIMDGFERALRAYSSMNAAYQGDEEPKLDDGQYDCVNINAEIFLKSLCSLPNIESKVLMTTRLTPRAVKPRGESLQGCREEKLDAMQKADAVEFFYKQKIKGTHAEIEAACAPYGYHPLSLRLLAGRILKDLHKPGDISVAQAIKIDGDLKQHQNHVLKVAYDSLPHQEQKLLSQIACFRSQVSFETLVSISKPVAKEKPKGLAGFFKKKAETGNLYTGNLESDLQDLIERGLLHRDPSKDKYDLHPIVRRYAYERLTAPDRTAVHTRLRDYFAAVDTPAKTQILDDLAPVIELYHHTVRAGEHEQAYKILYDRLVPNPLHFQFGAYELIIELDLALFPNGEDKLPSIKNEAKLAWLYNSLASSYSLSGQPRRAVPLFEMTNDIFENKTKNKEYLAIGLGNLAYAAQIYIGALKEANRNLRRDIELSRELGIEDKNADAHYELGRLLSYMGNWEESENELLIGLSLREKQGYLQAQSIVWSYRSLRSLLMVRADTQSKAPNLKLLIKSASRALELADETARKQHPYPVDYMRAYWLLGAAYRKNKDLSKAEQDLSKAISICRQINMVVFEADILLEIARLRYDQKNYDEAKSLADEALTITERCGYVLQGADVNLFLATLALEGYTLERFKFDGKRELSDKEVATLHAKEALKLAYCDGPPYYYKVAYHEAERLLEKLKLRGVPAG